MGAVLDDRRVEHDRVADVGLAVRDVDDQVAVLDGERGLDRDIVRVPRHRGGDVGELGAIGGDDLRTGLGGAQLQARAVRILSAETGLDEAAAEAALEGAGGDVATAIVMARTGLPLDAARAALEAAGGVIDRAARRTNDAGATPNQT